jgi:Lrp/AsnC family transcriptional regulator, leucine-responsive regulatory protein
VRVSPEEGTAGSAAEHRLPLDRVDRAILGLITAEARLSHREVARRVGMSPGAISDRIDRLERTGVIRGYHAEVDPESIGLTVEAFIGLQVAQGPPIGETMETLHAIPEVTGVFLVTGQWDLLVRVQVRDHKHLRDLLVDQVWRTPSFRHSETLMLLDSRRSGPADLLAAMPEPVESPKAVDPSGGAAQDR